MLATFIIEISLVVYTLWRYGLNAITRVAMAILVCLAVFQLAEYNVCEGAWGIDSAGWARVGYVAITLLPPLGINLIARLSGDKKRWPLYASYGAGLLFIGYFLLATNGIEAEACLGNYVIFAQGHNTGYAYGLYYYGLLIASIGYAALRAKTANRGTKKSLHALIIGYILFMVPTTVVNLIDPTTLAGIPSIMCGFAVSLALILAFAVLPLRLKKPAK